MNFRPDSRGTVVPLPNTGCMVEERPNAAREEGCG